MEGFIYSLALAALTGIGVLAYRHPEAFRARISVAIQLVLILAIVAVFSRLLGTLIGYGDAIDDAIKQLDSQDLYLASSLKAILEVKEQTVAMLLIVLGLHAYVMLLLYLPRLLGQNTKKTDE